LVSESPFGSDSVIMWQV